MDEVEKVKAEKAKVEEAKVEEAKKRAVAALEKLKERKTEVVRGMPEIQDESMLWYDPGTQETSEKADRFIELLETHPAESIDAQCLDWIIRGVLDIS